ncbi:LOW QUALITY PROTEIN: HAUS augmin-like complex subunit 8 [Sphaerodactylus townsendi]|uniref:LOW QUALITY PROTEIN: HAUS augmin-like complex subunit 8 n=1 Tax=Sphaerodactylus townsendi TaxID=933632 RepID=UPI002027567B|nr:LOW QUALITY PROTEIN: HAUS augmin-like complex subunit 8 [Sphaerodactylus townsendi]
MKDSSRKKNTLKTTTAEDLAAILDSQMLLLTYANMKIEKNVALLEEKSERDLLTVLKEREKLQTDVHRKKRRLLKLKKEQQLTQNKLDRQIEVLSPIVKQFGTFQEDYRHFATALDSTRHELPTKGIYMGENQSQFLADLQEKLTATGNILKQYPQEHTEHNAKALEAVKELEATFLKLSEELPRSVATMLDLSSAVSKEVSLQAQDTYEDTLGLEAVKWIYHHM